MKINKVAIKNGFRSGLEDDINESLKKSKKNYGYETEKISYIQPQTTHNYTPDFILSKKDGKKLYIESKGRWVMDIRFVFQNPNAKLYKGSKTTYAQYCDKKGWVWAKKEIPNEWLKECL
jgi:hypothetical protein